MSKKSLKNPAYLCVCPQEVATEETLYLSDGELCQKAQKGCTFSKNLLWARYQNFIRRVVYRRNHHYHLPENEMGDVLQEAYFAFHETVQRFDPEGHSRGKPASFKTFLGVVVVRQFMNYHRHWRCYRKHIAANLAVELLPCLAIGAEEDPAFPLGALHGCPELASRWKTMLLTEFSCDRLAEVLGGLKQKEICLIETWLHCGRDKEVARILDISAPAAKLRRERLFRRIKQLMVRNDTFLDDDVNNNNKSP